MATRRITGHPDARRARALPTHPDSKTTSALATPNASRETTTRHSAQRDSEPPSSSKGTKDPIVRVHLIVMATTSSAHTDSSREATVSAIARMTMKPHISHDSNTSRATRSGHTRSRENTSREGDISSGEDISSGSNGHTHREHTSREHSVKHSRNVSAQQTTTPMLSTP